MFEEALHHELRKCDVSEDEFSELLIRLLDYGVINREESQVETMLYDRYSRCISVVEEYLAIIKVRIHHDRKFCSIRAFPPGAKVPGVADDEHNAFNGGLRVRPTQQEVGIILSLRVEYEKALREGLVDEKGCVMLPLEGLAIALKNLLKRSLPESQSERKNLFKRLRQLRLIKYNADIDIDSAESWLSIQPAITHFVNEDVLAHLYPANEDSSEGEATDVL